MTRRRLANGLTVIGVAMLAGLLGRAWAKPPAMPAAVRLMAAQPAPLPAGPGQELVATRCITCHQLEMIVQQRLTPAQWSKELTKMVGWGASLTPSEQTVTAAYLAKHFPPDRSADPLLHGNLHAQTE